MGKVKTNFKIRRRTFIREWRKSKHLTLERVAERIGVTPGALSQLERGEINYTQPMLEALADAIGCEPADLIMRGPTADRGLLLVWSGIPDKDKAQALAVLRTFSKYGTNG